jgi:hypothetical protein
LARCIADSAWRTSISASLPSAGNSASSQRVCVAAHWVHHGSVWAPLRADATELLFLPSPRSNVDPVEALDAALRGPRVGIDGFVTALLAGDEVM